MGHEENGAWSPHFNLQIGQFRLFFSATTRLDYRSALYSVSTASSFHLLQTNESHHPRENSPCGRTSSCMSSEDPHDAADDYQHVVYQSASEEPQFPVQNLDEWPSISPGQYPDNVITHHGGDLVEFHESHRCRSCIESDSKCIIAREDRTCLRCSGATSPCIFRRVFSVFGSAAAFPTQALFLERFNFALDPRSSTDQYVSTGPLKSSIEPHVLRGRKIHGIDFEQF